MSLGKERPARYRPSTIRLLILSAVSSTRNGNRFRSVYPTNNPGRSALPELENAPIAQMMQYTTHCDYPYTELLCQDPDRRQTDMVFRLYELQNLSLNQRVILIQYRPPITCNSLGKRSEMVCDRKDI